MSGRDRRGDGVRRALAGEQPVHLPLVTVCSWCPDRDAQTAAARARGFEVSHGLCAACAVKLEPTLESRADAPPVAPAADAAESLHALARRTATDDAPLFIVAQVSCRWKSGVPVDPSNGILAERFQRVLNVNIVRGYRLFSFQMHGHSAAPGELHEAIVAVFERVTPPASGVTQ